MNNANNRNDITGQTITADDLAAWSRVCCAVIAQVPGLEEIARRFPTGFGAPVWRPPPDRTRAAIEGCYEVKDQTLMTSVLAQPKTVVTMDRRWRAIDVYAALPRAFFAVDGAYVRVFVYAKQQAVGSSALVGSGLAGRNEFLQSPSRVVRLAAVSGPVAQQYEVQVDLVGGTPTAGDKWTLSAVASDQSSGPDYEPGAVVMVGGVAAQGVLTTSAILPGAPARPGWQLRVLRGFATNTTGAARFLQLHDQPDTAACAGVAPVFSIGLPASGQAVPIGDECQGYRFGQRGLVAFPSSSASVGVGVAAGDVVYTLVVQ